jgi:zinc transport system ATP-binding protein
MTPLVSLEQVGVEFGGTPVLRGVTGSIQRGRITAMIGLNGSGKTTLLRTILGEVPHAGRITFPQSHGRPVIGYVPQRLVIDARLPLTVRDLFAIALQRRPVFLGVTSAVKDKTISLLSRVFRREPERMLHRPVEKLSGGELQRVLLALALEPSPELLLLDEPAAGIDFHDQDHFYDLICQLNHEQTITVVLVSHDTNMVTRHADHVLCLKDGRIHCEGPPGDVMTDEALAATFGDKAAYVHQHRH